MNSYFDTYCPACDASVRTLLSSRPATLVLRGEQVSFQETVAICPTCGEPIGDARIEGANLDRAYEAYRALHGILSPGEVKALRHSFGLSLREFSKFLGFGEQTAYRYEHGDLPDSSHNTTMLSARTAEGARLLLSQNAPKLSARSVARVEARIQAMATSDVAASRRVRERLRLEEREADAPSSANGYRPLDLGRAIALVYELAQRCQDLYWTKLQKALFFADTLSYERTSRSLSGLGYAHATYGPVIDHKDELRFILSERGVVTFVEQGWGEVLVPQRLDSQPFDAEELELIDEVAQFVNTFETARELSEFSHRLGSWQGSSDGAIIEYASDGGEVGRAVAGRLARA